MPAQAPPVLQQFALPSLFLPQVAQGCPTSAGFPAAGVVVALVTRDAGSPSGPIWLVDSAEEGRAVDTAAALASGHSANPTESRRASRIGGAFFAGCLFRKSSAFPSGAAHLTFRNNRGAKGDETRGRGERVYKRSSAIRGFLPSSPSSPTMLRSVLSLLLLGSAAAFSPALGSLAARRHTPAARMMFGGGDKKDGDGNFMDKLKVRASPRLQQPHTRTRRPFPRHVSRSHAALRRRQRTCSTPR